MLAGAVTSLRLGEHLRWSAGEGVLIGAFSFAGELSGNVECSPTAPVLAGA